MAGQYDLVAVVLAAEPVRIARLVARRGMSPGDAAARIRAQATDAERLAVADVVIRNDGSLPELDGRIERMWRQLRRIVELRRLAEP